MLSVKPSLQNIAEQTRQLLSCTSVHIVRDHPVQAFHQVILEHASPSNLMIVAESGEPTGASLLLYEQVRALCDIAIQRGHLASLNVDHWHVEHISLNSIAVVPVERPAGVLGLLLLTDTLPNAFGQGELLLLRRILPGLALALERHAEDFLTSSMCYPNSIAVSPIEPSAARRTSFSVSSANPIPPQTNQHFKGLDLLRKSFLSMLTHELRAPLTAIKGYAILLQAYGITSLPDEQTMKEVSSQADDTGWTETAAMTPSRQREYLDIIIEQTGHLEVLIQDLLDISRLQTGQLSLRSARVDIAQLCRRVLQIIEQRTKTQSPGRYTFRCDIDGDINGHLPPLWTDAHRVQQILTNLLENAIKYSPEGGLIELYAHPHTIAPASTANANIHPSIADMLAITVRDHGIGIPQQQQVRLFQPFSRIEHPLTRDVPGIGLGLYITCQLVEALGGTITIQSSEGQGTSFTVQLPYKQSAKD